jgi:tetratricopeptide (TPR) repeat protein
MQSERDWLVRFVFPRLRQELLQWRIHLVDVDLRWGVTSEQDALSVCREIVDECRPRFLCVLGGRYGWVPPGKTRSITADEVHYGVLDRGLTSRGFAYFYFRDPSATATMVETVPGEFREPAGSYGADALAELKTAIVDVGLQPFFYRAQWDDRSGRLIGLKAFGDRVYADVKQSIAQEFGPMTGEPPDEFTQERAAMEAFIEERIQRFVLGSRQPIWDELWNHAASTGGNGYLCLTGAAGSGKSAFLGKFCQDYRTASPQDLVIPHFVGASPGSTDVRRTLRRLCHELVTGTGLTAQIPEDPEKLHVVFFELLSQASDKKRIVILLDAINQFDPTTQLVDWSWLPETLPATARIMLSSLSGLALDSLRQRRQPPRLVELQPLDATDREAIIREFLNRYRKSLTAGQQETLLAKADAGTPLYLLVALEELRTLGTFEEISDRIAQLPPDIGGLFIWILKRLEADDGFRDASGRKIGQDLVPRFLALLAASRHGLSMLELVGLLSPGDLQGNVAALAQLLRPYLMQRGELLDYYHDQCREAAVAMYLPSETLQRQAHTRLADFFERHSTGSRQVGEFPWQLAAAKEWERLYDWLGDRESFLKAWEYDAYDVRTQWAQLEVESPLRMTTAYHTQIANPEAETDKDFLALLATLLNQNGYPDAALHMLRHLDDHFRGNLKLDALTRVWGEQAAILRSRGDLDKAMAVCKEEERISRRVGNLDVLQSALFGQALILRDRGDWDGALKLLTEQERICRLSNDRKGLYATYSVQALIIRDRGDLDGAMALHREAEKICRQLGDLDGLQVVLNNQAVILLRREDFDGAMVLIQEQERICRQLGNKKGLAQSLTNKGSILYRRGDLDGAMALQEDAERICRQLDYPDCLQSVLGAQALVLKAHKDLDGAMALLTEAEQICRRLDNQDGLQETLGDQALILMERGELGRAWTLLQEKERICRQTGIVEGLVWAQTYQGGILCEQGETAEGLRVVEEACRLAATRGNASLAQKTKNLLDAVRERIQRD